MKAHEIPALLSILMGWLAIASASLRAEPREVRFRPSSDIVEVHDFLELTVEVERPDTANPFTDVAVEGSLVVDGGAASGLEGFCDSPDGRTFKIRFLPTRAGAHRHAVTYRQGAF